MSPFLEGSLEGRAEESPPALPLGRWALLKVFIRSFAIQGSWNERTMQGGGFAFALLPALRALHPEEPGRVEEGLRRHVEHFNAHPYLAELALGAVIHLEARGTPPEEIRRFKSVLRGPLGSLGDSLVWAGWLPACSLLALSAALLGAGPWGTILLFLLLYNTGHLLLRGWVFQAGLREGREVGRWLHGAQLARHSGRVAAVGTVLLGVVLGLGFVRGASVLAVHWLPLGAGALLVWAGALRGLELRRPAWILFLSVVLLFLLKGILP